MTILIKFVFRKEKYSNICVMGTQNNSGCLKKGKNFFEPKNKLQL